MSRTEYDEDAVLTAYIWDHYQELMTDLERSVGNAVLIRMQADLYADPNPLQEPLEWLQRNELDTAEAREAIEHP